MGFFTIFIKNQVTWGEGLCHHFLAGAFAIASDTDVLVSFDVTALFTKVPVDKSLEVIFDKLENDPPLPSRSSLTTANIRDLLSICLKITYLIYYSQIYTQVEGAAMGSPVGPIVPNLYVEWFKVTAFQSFPFNMIIWKLFVDDTIVTLCDSLIQDLTDQLISIDPAIQFTREEENNLTLPMLDTLTTRDPEGNLSFTVYSK